MIQVKNLTLTHRKDLRDLAADFSFVINDGDKAAIIGEEGNGKSTLLKWVYDPGLIESYCEWSGEQAGDPGLLGYLAQDLGEEEKAGSVYDFCAASPDFFDMTPRELADIARQLRFPAEEFYSGRPVASLSGGERIKLQLGRLLFSCPAALLLDEPSSDLDLETLEWLEDFIGGFPGSVLYISHDETLIENTATMVLHMEHPREGKPPRCSVHRLDYSTYISRRTDAIADQTRQARKEREEYDKKLEKYRRIQQSVEHAQNAISRQNPSGGRLLKKKMHAVMSMGRRFDREAEDMTQLPEVEEAAFLRFPEGTAVPAGAEGGGEAAGRKYPAPCLRRGEGGHSGPQRGGEDHSAAPYCGGTAGPAGPEGGVYVAGLCRHAAAGQDAGGVSGSGGGRGLGDPGQDLSGKYPVYPAGDEPSHSGAVRRAEGQVADDQDDAGRGERADSG